MLFEKRSKHRFYDGLQVFVSKTAEKEYIYERGF
jgi:hypothetical protein